MLCWCLNKKHNFFCCSDDEKRAKAQRTDNHGWVPKLISGDCLRRRSLHLALRANIAPNRTVLECSLVIYGQLANNFPCSRRNISQAAIPLLRTAERVHSLVSFIKCSSATTKTMPALRTESSLYIGSVAQSRRRVLLRTRVKLGSAPNEELLQIIPSLLMINSSRIFVRSNKTDGNQMR